MSMSSIETHLRILQELQSSRAAELKFPDCGGLDILDIGCGIGQHLLGLVNARSLHGIDIDAEAIRYASQAFPCLTLQCACAEAIPYPAASFDLTYSSVSIPYTRIRAALAEVFRVTRPGGTVWMSLHGVEMERVFTWSVIRRLKIKDLIKRAYVWLNGFYFALTGDTFYRPGSKVMESFQFKGAMRRALHRAGFVDVQFDKEGYKLMVQARRPYWNEVAK
jgi:ubiquinone/menaquinone biosynthesis C-methylase UbiE